MNKIFGYDFADIQRAQRGGRLGRTVDVSAPVDHAPTEADRALLAQHGSVSALKAAGFFGSADRLERAGACAGGTDNSETPPRAAGSVSP